MHTLRDIQSLANQLLAQTFTLQAKGMTYNINPKELGYVFRFDHARRRLGCCHYNKREITMSKPLCLENLDKVHGKLTDTLLHEIAHALCVEVYGIRDGRGHGRNWISIATQIGCDGKRCYDGDKMNKVASKYTLVCPTCSKESPMHRRPKRSYACHACCNGSYDSQHKLIIKQNY